MARKILLADDSVTAQNMGRKILADAGYEVIAVNNGSAALKKIAELKPDLIILDVYMPGYSGLEVCQRLKESPETARIPVLLTVGKLEPFKPEEAQRVRAEGYIVKPFEASELLSALSKLEDKVVPRSEPSKPGRFARAMKTADENDQNNPPRTENGWKSRITFPSKIAKLEDKIEEEYTPASRSLEKFKESDPASSAQVPERNLDVAALAPEGFPNAVTSAEIAAITSAAAQIQMAGEALRRDHETPSAAEASPEFSVAPEVEKFEGDVPVSTEPPAEESHRRRKDDQKSEETPDLPATMAAHAEPAQPSASGAPRWTAVPVALENDEAAISLDQEMQKAHAIFATPGDATVASQDEPTPVQETSSSAAPQAAIEAPVAAISSPEPESVQAEAGTQPEVQPEPVQDFVSGTQPGQAPESIQKESAPAATCAEISQSQEFSAPEPAPVPASEFGDLAPEPAVPAFEAAAVSVNPEPESDPETVKTTAAAWANWSQVRDSSQPGTDQLSQDQLSQDQVSQNQTSDESSSQAKPFDPPEPVQPQAAAMAAAAGAEQSGGEATSTTPERNPEDVASIVDSVLAGLRPRLMEEISRKMSEKK